MSDERDDERRGRGQRGDTGGRGGLDEPTRRLSRPPDPSDEAPTVALRYPTGDAEPTVVLRPGDVARSRRPPSGGAGSGRGEPARSAPEEPDAFDGPVGPDRDGPDRDGPDRDGPDRDGPGSFDESGAPDEPVGSDRREFDKTVRLDAAGLPAPVTGPQAADDPGSEPESGPERTEPDAARSGSARSESARSDSAAGGSDRDSARSDPDTSGSDRDPDAGRSEPDADRSGSDESRDGSGAPAAGRRQRISTAGAIIGVLLGLLGFALVVQLRSNAADPGLATARPEDLVRILSDLDARQDRLRGEIASLEETQRQLASGAQGREAALNEARRRADQLGILAGSLPAQGPGLEIQFVAAGESIKATTILDAVEELRGAGAEAMQISGEGSPPVRVIASTYFVADGDDLVAGGVPLKGRYTLAVIGDPKTMHTALNIPGGVVETVRQRGGNVIVQERDVIRVSALHQAGSPRYARPVS